MDFSGVGQLELNETGAAGIGPSLLSFENFSWTRDRNVEKVSRTCISPAGFIVSYPRLFSTPFIFSIRLEKHPVIPLNACPAPAATSPRTDADRSTDDPRNSPIPAFSSIGEFSAQSSRHPFPAPPPTPPAALSRLFPGEKSLFTDRSAFPFSLGRRRDADPVTSREFDWIRCERATPAEDILEFRRFRDSSALFHGYASPRGGE